MRVSRGLSFNRRHTIRRTRPTFIGVLISNFIWYYYQIKMFENSTMRIRDTNNENFITFDPIKPGKRYWTMPININKNGENDPRYVLLETTIRSLMRADASRTNRVYGQISLARIPRNNVLFKHPIMRNRNVTRRNLREYIKPLYRVKTPRRSAASVRRLKHVVISNTSGSRARGQVSVRSSAL